MADLQCLGIKLIRYFDFFIPLNQKYILMDITFCSL